MRAVHLRIEGSVQGVGYRAWTRRAALSLGLSGWVRNRPDGSVEAHVQGADEAVAEMIARCRQGPEAAHVTQVMPQPADPGVFQGFEMRETA
jgi:acylphosphatase